MTLQTAIIHTIEDWNIVETYFGKRSRGVISARLKPDGSLEWCDINLYDAVTHSRQLPQNLTDEQLAELQKLMVSEAKKVMRPFTPKDESTVLKTFLEQLEKKNEQ